MKIVILGPVVNKTLSGGVGVFDEGLYHGFEKIGDEVQIISLAKSSTIDNVVVGNGDNKVSRIYLKYRSIAKEIARLNPDMVISSLQYSMGIKTYKKYCKNALFVQVLHGFPCQINGKFKAWAVNRVAKYSRKHFDKVVTVSFLSYAINKKLITLLCDAVIHNGCNLVPNNVEVERNVDFVYVGRLFRDKEVEMIGDAFALLKKKNPNVRVAIAGYGELEPLFTSGRLKDSGIEYLGRLSQPQVRDILSHSKFFISMNPLEPFGIVFNEALMNGCNIITQTTAGCVPLFMTKPYYHPADVMNADELANLLKKTLTKFVPIPNEDKMFFADYLSYERCAKEYKNLLKKEN